MSDMIKAEVIDALVAAGCTAEQLAAAVKADQASNTSNAERQARYRSRGGGKIPPELRALVYERDGFTCLECGTEDNLCCDHAVPVSKGGETTLDNLQTLCVPCNSRKKDRIRKYESRIPRTSTDIPWTSIGAVSPKKETSPEPPKEKTTPSIPVPPARIDFDQFWSLFPNKVGKRDAEREFGLALKRSSFEAIMAGLRRYVAKTDDRPWCNPTTFLHQDRWDDQPANPVPRVKATSPPPAETVGSLSKRQLFQGPKDDASNDTTGRVVQIDAGRLEGGPGSPRSFAVSGNLLGRV